MKRLVTAFIIALAIHGFVFSLGGSWMNVFSPVPGPPTPITISLAVRKHPQPDKIPAAKTKKVDAANKIHTAPVAAEPQNIPAPPQKPVPVPTTTTPVIPPNVEKPPLPRKPNTPKKSLKRLTRIKPTVPAPAIARDQPEARPQLTSAPVHPVGSVKTPRNFSENNNKRSTRRPVSESAVSSGDAPRHAGSPVTAAEKGPSTSATVKIARPLYVKNATPRYPRRARKMGFEGIMVLEVLVDKNGKVEDLKLLQSSGHAILDKTAVASVKKWVFAPGAINGAPAKMWVKVPLRFELN